MAKSQRRRSRPKGRMSATLKSLTMLRTITPPLSPDTHITDETGDNLLFDSPSLTAEEQALRNELTEWAKAKLRRGHRPIPLYVALKIVTGWMADPDSYGLRE